MAGAGIPKGATFEHRVAGKRPTDNRMVAVLVLRHNDTRYSEWSIDGDVVYRKQYSGRNLRHLATVLADIREGVTELEESCSLQSFDNGRRPQ